MSSINNIHFICADASKVTKDNYDVVIVDPPRSGLTKYVIKILKEIKSSKIVYVSCNPKTLKRDINLLDNYVLKKLECVNMFNKTKHIECVSLLERK